MPKPETIPCGICGTLLKIENLKPNPTDSYTGLLECLCGTQNIVIIKVRPWTPPQTEEDIYNDL